MEILSRRLGASLALALVCAGASMAQSAPPTPPAGQGLDQAAVAPATGIVVPPKVDPWAAAPEAEKKVLAQVDGFVAAGKWKSAWDALAAADVSRSDPWLLARAISLALDGSVDSKELLAFTFVDLPEGESLEAARKSASGSGEIEFDPVALRDAQIAAKTDSVPVLDYQLGRYLGEVAVSFEGSWRLPDQEVLSREADARAAARAGGVYDADSLQAETEIFLNMGDAKSAETLAAAAEGLGEPAPRLRYDHAISLLMQQRYAEGLALVDAGLAVDKDPDSRSAALGLAAQAASLAGDEVKVEAYLSQAEQETPDSSRPYLLRHYLYVSKGDEDKANAAADQALKRFGPDSQIISTLVKTWFDAGDPAASLPFLERGLAAYPSDDAAMTIFGIYKSLIVIRTAKGPEDLKDVGALLDATEAHAQKAFAGHQDIMNAIDSLRANLAAMTAPPAAEPAPGANDSTPQAAPGAEGQAPNQGGTGG